MAAFGGLYPWQPPQRWIKHYSSNHQILLVGEGDFSFSLSLALAFKSATNIVATSLDTYEELLVKYCNARENLKMLKTLGATLLHGVDATQMSLHYFLHGGKFHRIIFNFPHAGFHGREDNPTLIEKHRNLVRGFLQNASKMLFTTGEIHVNHKVTPPFTHWKLEDLASECSLIFVGLDMFKIRDFQWYENKRGSGLRPDDPFPLGESRTYRFQLHPSSVHTPLIISYPNPYPAPPPQQLQPSNNTHHAFNEVATECRRIFGRYLDHAEETFGSMEYDVGLSVREALNAGYETYMKGVPGRSLSGYIAVLEELHQLSLLRSQKLRDMLSQHV